jgi:GGDEF domain-containing protein
MWIRFWGAGQRIKLELAKFNNGQSGKINMSIGWATYDDSLRKDESLDQLIDRADKQLYAAKKSKHK